MDPIQAGQCNIKKSKQKRVAKPDNISNDNLIKYKQGKKAPQPIQVFCIDIQIL